MPLLTNDEILAHYDTPESRRDPLVKEYGSAEVRQYADTEFLYMIIETDRLPGIKVGGTWDSYEEFWAFLDSRRDSN